MKRRLALPFALAAFALAGCSSMSSMMESMNPFSSSTKMEPLPAISAKTQARVIWRESVGKREIYAFSPAIVGSTVYAAGKDGSLIRIDDGKVAWKIKTGQDLSGGVGADLAVVAVGTPKGEVLAFSASDGAPLWKAKATSEVLTPPAVGDDLVVVRSGDNRLAAYDPVDGRRKWTYQRPTPALSLRVTAGPIIEGKYVVAGFPGGKLIAVSAANGAALWDGTVALPKGTTELDRVADITSAPVIAGKSICAVSFQGRVACFDANGALAWAREMSSAVGLAVDGRNLYVTDDKSAIHALDATTGGSLWKQDKLATRNVTAPAVLRDMIVVADGEGYVHFLSREDGSFVGRVATDGSAVVAQPRVMHGDVIVQTSGGGVYAIEAE
jgi:outer membrane protein assembly factor BamB